MNKYSWREGSRVNIDPQAVGEALEELGPTYRPPDVVNAARGNPSHPLNGYFIWDDTAAGEQWRIEQARYITRAMRVEVYVESQPEPIVTRAFVHVSLDKTPVYAPVADVMSNADWRTVAIADVKMWLRQAVARLREYEAIAEDLTQIRSGIQRLIEDLDGELKEAQV